MMPSIKRDNLGERLNSYSKRLERANEQLELAKETMYTEDIDFDSDEEESLLKPTSRFKGNAQQNIADQGRDLDEHL